MKKRSGEKNRAIKLEGNFEGELKKIERFWGFSSIDGVFL